MNEHEDAHFGIRAVFHDFPAGCYPSVNELRYPFRGISLILYR